MRTFHRLPLIITQALILFLLPGCGLLDDLMETPEPTKSKMQGIWKVTEAYNEDGKSILDSINFPITLFQLKDNINFTSTAGPMFTRIIYGGSKYTNIASKVDQVFRYASLNVTTDGEWNCAEGETDRFTIEVDIRGLVPGMSAMTDLLRTIGINSAYLNIFDDVIFHKFMDVHVTFDNYSDSTMTWEFDDQTTAVYNYKDDHLDYKSWDGVSADNFSHCKFVLRKQVKDLEDLVKEAAQK